MPHLSEKIAEFVFAELSSNEIAEAQRHLAACADCRNEVESFKRTHAFLKHSPDVEPPRRIIFEAEKRSFAWRWVAPLAAAAAIILAVLIAAPIQVRWQDSQVTIAFREISQNPAPVPDVIREPVAQPVDYEGIIATVRESQQVWLANELKARDVAHSHEIQRLNGNVAYLESMQRAMYRDTLDNASSIQLLAKSETQE